MNRVAAPPVSAQKPCIGVSRVLLSPMVRTIRQPPISVPSAIAAWHASTTQNGIEKCSPRWPCEYSRTAMIPMVFCASLQPSPSEHSHHEGHEIEERRPDHRILRPQYAGRHDGRDRIGGVVQSVEKVEQQRNPDQDRQNR